MSEIYSVISVLMVLILKELNIQTLRLISPILKNIFMNHNEMILYRLESIMDECTYSKQVPVGLCSSHPKASILRDCWNSATMSLGISRGRAI